MDHLTLLIELVRAGAVLWCCYGRDDAERYGDLDEECHGGGCGRGCGAGSGHGSYPDLFGTHTVFGCGRGCGNGFGWGHGDSEGYGRGCGDAGGGGNDAAPDGDGYVQDYRWTA